MNFLTLENVSKSYGEKVLFRNISLHIDKGQKIGLIAKNGTGKSTLMRVIAGKEGSEGENARIVLRKDLRIGWLDQEPRFAPESQVLDAVLDAANPKVDAMIQYERALRDNALPERLQEAMSLMDRLEAWDFEARVKEMLGRFGFADFTQKVGRLSGGQQKRLALVKILLEEPEFLILDEPTNHLDVDMIEWLEDYLQQPGLTIFMVTHDRYFLENVCDSIIELEGGQLYRYKGSYSDYLEKKALREEVESTTYERQKKLLKNELEWVRRSPAARTTKAKARVDAYHERKEANDRLKPKSDEMSIRIKETWLGSKVVELHGVSKRFGEKTVLQPFSYKFKRGEKVGIVGPNGAGKSTFLQLLTGALPPDTGKVVIGDTIRFGYYRQEGIQLAADKRVIDAVRDIAEVIPLEKGRELTAAQLLERFLFSRAQQQVYVSQLSGGERRRLYLLTVLMDNPNFLILDEPTNDLDVLTLQVLEDFLQDYPGCLVVVTHDRYFMDRLVDHLFAFEGEGLIRDFNGTHAEYRLARRQEAQRPKPVPLSAPVPSPAVKTGEGLSSAERNELKRLEKDLKKLEDEKKSLLARFDAADLSPEDATRMSQDLARVQSELDEKEMRWLELSDK
ncbi:MAG: ABC-F family ATP-binding cassette domain-containing protein [Saprospiraceae bacterium]